MGAITLAIMGSDGSPKSQLIEHVLWLGGHDPKLVHSYLVVEGLVFHMTYTGLEIVPIEDFENLLGGWENHIIADGFSDEFIHEVLKRAFTFSRCRGVSVLDAARTFFNLPTYGPTCHSFVGAALGFEARWPVDLFRGFLQCTRNNRAQIVSVHTTLTFQNLMEGGVSPMDSFLMACGCPSM